MRGMELTELQAADLYVQLDQLLPDSLKNISAGYADEFEDDETLGSNTKN